jgi:hypothetical protein
MRHQLPKHHCHLHPHQRWLYASNQQCIANQWHLAHAHPQQKHKHEAMGMQHQHPRRRQHQVHGHRNWAGSKPPVHQHLLPAAGHRQRKQRVGREQQQAHMKHAPLQTMVSLYQQHSKALGDQRYMSQQQGYQTGV